MATGMSEKPKLLLFISEDYYYWSHRRPLALAALDVGYEVALVTRVGGMQSRIEADGVRVISLAISRGGMNPLEDLRTVFQLFGIYRRERPALVHHVAIKPVIYGSLAARLAGVTNVVNALAGLGFAFISQSRRGRALQRFVRMLLRAALARGLLILQNPDDVTLLCREHLIVRDRVRLVRGAGVDLDRFRPAAALPSGAPVVVLPARMLWDKGVGEFVAAARRLRAGGSSARFVLVGGRDDENPEGIDGPTLADWQREGAVEWWGHRDDMPSVLAQATIACLPSYREGLPKALLEAAACALPIVATDVPGCREVVCNGENGLLVPPRDAAALADALAALLSDPVKRRTFATASRALAERDFAEKAIVSRVLAVYAEFAGAKLVDPPT